MGVGDPFSKGFRQDADSFQISAIARNELMDAARDQRGKINGGEQGNAGTSRRGPTVKILNSSGSDVPAGGVLGIDGVAITDADDLPSFKNFTIYTGVTPTVPDYVGFFAIAAEPIPNGKIGKAFITGGCPAQVNMVSTSDEYADITDSDVTQLTSGAVGGVQILYVASGTGLKWAIVRFGAPANRVRLTITGPYSGANATNFSPYTTSANISLYNLAEPCTTAIFGVTINSDGTVGSSNCTLKALGNITIWADYNPDNDHYEIFQYNNAG